MWTGTSGRRGDDRRRGRRLAALLVLALLAAAFAPLGPRPVAAASAVRIGATANFGGNFQPDRWVPITVALANDGAGVTGEVVAQTDGVSGRDETRYFQRVELPARSQKVLTLYVLTQYAAQVNVRFQSGKERVDAPPVTLRRLRQGQQLVGVLGDDAGASTAIARGLLSAYGSAVEAVPVAPEEVPGNPYGLESFAAIVLNDASTGRWSEEQRQSLAVWVARGGQLVVAGGPHWRKTGEGLGELPPTRPGDSRVVNGLAGLGRMVGLAGGPGGDVVVSVGEPIPGAARLAEQDGVALVASRGWGRGTVTALAFDLAGGGFAGWTGAGAFWKRLGLDAAPPASLQDPFTPSQSYQSGSSHSGTSSMNRILQDLPSLALPPTWLLLLVMLAFITAVGPLNYLVLRRLDRRELAWVTIPLLTLLFAGGIYGFGAGTKGRAVIVNTVSVVRIAPGARAAEVQSFYGVFTPSRGARQLPLGRDALVTGFSSGGLGESDLGSDVRFEQGPGATIHDAYFAQWTLRSVAAQATVDPAPLALRVELRQDGARVVGQITNGSNGTIEDVTLLLDGAYHQLGNLAPGAAATVNWAPSGSYANRGYSGYGQWGAGLGSTLYQTGGGYQSYGSGQMTTAERRAELLDALSDSVFSSGPAATGPSGSAARSPYTTPTPTPTPVARPNATPGSGAAQAPLQVLFWRPDVPLELKIGTGEQRVTTLVIQELYLGAPTGERPGQLVGGR